MNPSSLKTLLDRHRDELQASGIDDAMIEAAGIYSANGQIRDILGWMAPGLNSWGEGWVIPFRDADGNDTGYSRVKLDHPRSQENGKIVKYESPKGKPNRVYFPPSAAKAIQASELVIITEGEKKALKGAQDGFATIGLVGVWGWQARRLRTDTGRAFGERGLVPDLAWIDWNGKRVFLAFDSDAAEKASVQLAEARLAECFTKAGADVRIVRFPSDQNGGKVGLDDYLFAHGPEALQKLLDAAKPSEQPPPPAPMDWARMFVEDQYTITEGTTLKWWRDEFHAWDGRRYRVIPTAELKAILLQWLDVRTKATPKLAADVITCLGSEIRVPFDVEQPALLRPNGITNPDWTVVDNGILDLRQTLETGNAVIHRHTPNYFTPTALPFPFHAEAMCPVWYQTLKEIFDGDDECFQLSAEWFGYNLVDDTSHQCIMLMEGPPRSGKGTVLRTLKMITGADNCVNPRFATMGETFGLMGLLGKRVAICPDAHLGHGDKAIGVMELLKLISGENSVEVHRKHLPPITTRLRIKFTLAVNELPKFGDNAGAISSRLLILPFRNSFLGREDRQLERKLIAEAEGILSWAIWGLKRLRAHGRFTRPKVSEQIEHDFERLSSPVKAFLQDECTLGPTQKVRKTLLWEAWFNWCKANGHESGSRERFGARLHSIAGVRRSQPRDETGQQQDLYAGVSLGRAVDTKTDTG